MSHPVFDITGRVALVSGSSRGIGYALARALLEAGCTVVVNSRQQDPADAAAASLRSQVSGGQVAAVAFDVTDEQAVRDGVAAAEESAGPIDILVNNAGMQERGSILDLPAVKWQELVSTNLTSAFLLGREVAVRMAGRGGGKIINVCSVQSELARPGTAAYAAAKGGLKMLTRGMCADLAPQGIQVNGLGPGYLQTDLTADLARDEAFSTWLRRRTPAGRWGVTDDLTGALIFLASPASGFVNGQVIYVDGGVLAVL